VQQKFCDFLKLSSLKKEELFKILKKSYELKYKIDVNTYKPFANKTLAMVFEKPSTRTRVSFEVGMFQLGGHALYLNSKDIQIGRGETTEDTARILSEYVDLVMIRTFEQEIVEKLAEFATIPIINGLTDLYHPCQILSDIFSIMEEKKELFNFDLKFDIANKKNMEDIQKSFNSINFLYVGDSTSNVANSLMDAASIFGMQAYFLSPKNYELNADLLKNAKVIAKENGGRIECINNINELDKKIDVVYTDIWISMGKEEEQKERYEAFKNYQVNKDLLEKHAKKDVIVMHCLPAHRGEEITNEVIESKNSIVFKQAGNRLDVQKAIMLYTMNEL
jgi:ornithine carbamoyltransferase